MVATDLRAKTTIERYTAQQKQSLILFMLASTHQALCTCWWSMPPKAVWGNTWEPGDPQAWTTPLMWPRCLRNSSPSKTCSRVPTRSPEEWSTLHLKGYVIEGCASGRQKWKNHGTVSSFLFMMEKYLVRLLASKSVLKNIFRKGDGAAMFLVFGFHTLSLSKLPNGETIFFLSNNYTFTN